MAQTGKAPRFDTDPISAKVFFDSVKELGTRAGLSDDKVIEWAIRYAGSHGISWDRVPECRKATAAQKFDQFRVEVLKLYPTLDEESRYTLHDLDALVDRFRALSRMTCESYGEYSRLFTACTGFLIDKGRLSDREASRFFLRGLPGNLHTPVLNRLTIRRPDVLPDIGYVLADIQEAALFVLRSRDLEWRGRDDSTPTVAPASKDDIAEMMASFARTISANFVAPAPAPEQPEPPARRPPPPNNRQGPAPGGANHSAPRWPQRNQSNQSNSSNQSQPPPLRCLFCGEPGHFVGECVVAEEYVNKGWIIRNEEWKLVLPNGNFLPRGVPGRTMKERLDTFYRHQGGPNRGNHEQTMSANFLEGIDDSVFTLDITPVEESREPESSTSTYLLQQEAEMAEEFQVLEAQMESLKMKQEEFAKKKGNFDGVHLPSKSKHVAPKKSGPDPESKKPNLFAQGPPHVIKPKVQGSDKGKAVETPEKGPQAQGPIKSVEYPFKPSSDDPKYLVRASIEDPNTTKDIANRALDATLELSTRELLASSSEVRKYFKEAVSSKKVSANVVEEEDSIAAYLSAFSASDFERDDDIPTAAASLPLRVIHPEFAPGFHPESILDSGAQACIIRSDVWERLNVPLSTDKVMKMEAANSETTFTIGVVEDYPIRLGKVVIKLQLQVVKDAPFQVLLGRPFFDVTSSSEVSERGGHHTLLINNPNVGGRFKVVTHPRFHKTPRINFRG